jgi:predicted  nucleic acid-binding Zn-ribbon protein
MTGVRADHRHAPSGLAMTDEELDALRAEVRRLRAAVHHLEQEKRDLEQRLAFLAQELAYTRAKVPPGSRTS